MTELLKEVDIALGLILQGFTPEETGEEVLILLLEVAKLGYELEQEGYDY